MSLKPSLEHNINSDLFVCFFYAFSHFHSSFRQTRENLAGQLPPTGIKYNVGIQFQINFSKSELSL